MCEWKAVLGCSEVCDLDSIRLVGPVDRWCGGMVAGQQWAAPGMLAGVQLRILIHRAVLIKVYRIE